MSLPAVASGPGHVRFSRPETPCPVFLSLPSPFQVCHRRPLPGGLPDRPGWIRGPWPSSCMPLGGPSSGPRPLRLRALEDRPRLCPAAWCQAGSRLTIGAQ